ncbi:hypothetical protein F5148DRAFT_1194976 [Russula earlei]|uniref:Uncharacterized protein n=1 Tax=Russula earlei TaxID=71964 RepID=A0ACC0UA40_9AGAM|nr:hypothetical protein F5148DRAFT_1194976 [Russula earlei]
MSCKALDTLNIKGRLGTRKTYAITLWAVGLSFTYSRAHLSCQCFSDIILILGLGVLLFFFHRQSYFGALTLGTS